MSHFLFPGGDSKTLMIVQVAPVEKNVGETNASLNFASRVRTVELGMATKKIEGLEGLVSIIESIHHSIMMRTSLLSGGSREGHLAPCPPPCPPPPPAPPNPHHQPIPF